MSNEIKINDDTFAREMIKDYKKDINDLKFRLESGNITKEKYKDYVFDIRKKMNIVVKGYFPE